MTHQPASLLIVDSDMDFGRTLADEAQLRAYRAQTTSTLAGALQLMHAEPFDALLVDLAPGAESAFELLSELDRLASDSDVIVMSDGPRVSTAIQWYDPDAFTFARKTDILHLFSTLAGVLERRRMRAQNRRLVWELQTVNEIASGIAQSLELEEILAGALQRLVRAMGAAEGSIRLRDRATGRLNERAAVPSSGVEDGSGRRASVLLWPSEEVVATRAAVVVEDFTEAPGRDPAVACAVRSAISVPMLAGNELLGTISLGSVTPRRFEAADQQLLGIIAGQIVVAVQNARLHQSVRRAKLEWERTFDAISDPIGVFNNRGELLRGNRALAHHLSLPVTAVPHLTCAEVGFCGGAGSCPNCAVGRALQQQHTRAEVTLADGRIFSVMTLPMGPPSDGPSVVQVAKNVTEEIEGARRLRQMSSELGAMNERLVDAFDQLKATQAQLVQAEKLSAMGQLVAGVAHELNNPLTSVIGYAQLVEEELRGSAGERPRGEVADDLRRIAEESHRAARIVRNLLVFARRQGAERAPQDVAEICRRVLALRAYAFRLNGLHVRTELPAGLPHVLADGGQLQQVLLNLVLNAEQAMRDREPRRLTVGARFEPEANAVELSVADSGHGIEGANLSRIFDPFFTTREIGEGTGLGLSICYGIVRDHGGQISVTSEPGGGTIFRVALPAPAREGAPLGMPVLVAHAEQSEREFLGAVLRGWGYRPVLAGTFRETVETYNSGSVQMALLDRGVLAVDPDAWRRRRQADRRQLPLIVISATPHDPGIDSFKGDAVTVLTPPLGLVALYGAVQAGVRQCTP